MAKKGIEKIVQEALLKGYTVNRSEDRFEISKPGKKLISLVILILPTNSGHATK